MRKVPPCPRALVSLSISLFLLLAAAAPARAETAPARSGSFVYGEGNGSGGAGLGVGAAAFLGGMTGVEVVYDQPRWHLEGLLGFNSRDVNNGPNPPIRTEFTFGVRAWYHLHQGSNSDFSIGGGVGFDHVSVSNNGGSGTQTFLEPGAQARIFLSPNFALFGLAGFTLDFGDNVGGVNSGVALGSQLTAGFGFTYFFR
jgi:hypothetical protein